MKKMIFCLTLVMVLTGFLCAQTEASEWNWVSISAGENHTAAIRIDGTLWTWGNNRQGQLGDGTTTIMHSIPIQIGTDSNWASVSAGESHTVALRTDGTLWTWGNNFRGQLGDGTTINRNAPIQIGPATNWASVSAGNNYTVAVRTNNTLWAWGFNNRGSLGIGEWDERDSNHRNVPIRIGADSNWATVSAGGSHTIGVRMDGTLWAWGENTHGKLGDGTATGSFDVNCRNTPTQIGMAPRWISASASAGSFHTVSIGIDGALWTWGNNEYSRLGDGTTTHRKTPTRIGADTNWASVSPGVNIQWLLETMAHFGLGEITNKANLATAQQPVAALLPESGQIQTGHLYTLVRIIL
jgi:alpha-tubulin suppressor-like RCC1 family protein